MIKNLKRFLIMVAETFTFLFFFATSLTFKELLSVIIGTGASFSKKTNVFLKRTQWEILTIFGS